MSDQIPISLHNSDLFLNKDFTDTDRNKNNTENAKAYSNLKKGPSLGENNQLISVHTSYLLPPLQSSPYLSKAVTEYLLTTQNLVNRYKKREVEQNKDRDERNWSDKENKALLPVTIKKAKPSLNLGRRLSNKASFCVPLRYELGSGLTLRSKAKIEAKQKYDAGPKPSFVEKTEPFASDQTKDKPTPAPTDLEIDSSTTTVLFGLPLPVQLERLLNKLNKGIICSGISREFLLVTTNLILFSVLAVVQRSHYGKGSPLTSGSGYHTIFCRSKVPNLTPAYLSTAEVRQYLHEIKPGQYNLVRGHKAFTVPWRHQKQDNLVGVFLGKPCMNSFQTKGVKTNDKGDRLPYHNEALVDVHTRPTNTLFGYGKERSLSFFLQSPTLRASTGQNTTSSKIEVKNLSFFSREKKLKPLLSTRFSLNRLPTTKPHKSTDLSEYLIKPWYCIKACNTSNKNVVATRSVWKLKNSWDLYNDNKIRGFQYYLPCYKSQERVFAETDTIPSKRAAVYSQKKRDLTGFTRSFFALTPFDQSDNLFYNKVVPKQSSALPKQGKVTHGPSPLAVSDSVLKRFFYKYGLFVVSPSKKTSGSQPFNQADKDYLTNSQRPDEIKQLSALTETENSTIDLGEQSKTLYTHQNKDLSNEDFGIGQLHNKGKLCYAIPKRRFNIIANKMNFALHKNVESSRIDASLAKTTHARNKSHLSFTTTKPSYQGMHPFFISYKQNDYWDRFVSNFGKALLPLMNETEFHRYCSALNKVSHVCMHGKASAWSRFNLTRLRFASLVQVRNAIPVFGFMPDSLLRNTSVSGYQFPELQQNEIAYLFRKNALFHFYFHSNVKDRLSVQSQALFKNEVVPKPSFGTSKPRLDAKTKLHKNPVLVRMYDVSLVRKARTYTKTLLDNKTFFQKLFAQLTIPFRTFKSGDLVNQVLTTPFLIHQNGVVISQTKGTRTEQLPKREPGHPYSLMGMHPYRVSQPQELEFKSVKHTVPSFEVNDLEMQYTQVDLDEIKNIKDLFEKLERNYEDYLRQPKDSLPALIISPSLEDDREIEEEGIQIFRKRDLVKNKKTSSNDQNGEPTIDSTLFLPTTTPELPEKKSISSKAASKSEMQDHQLLVKNALRQAQEEIDNIAKKEEKGTEKEKQVIPPLTRLEALYTIRNRERRREQAKDLRFDRSILSYLRSCKNKMTPKQVRSLAKTKFSGYAQKAKFSYRSGTKPGYAAYETKPAAKNISLPIFENLFLYSDKPNSFDRNEHVPERGFDMRSTWVCTPWLFSRFGDETICNDRKHSFFGEMSLPSKRLTAQEQKQVFQQKANPLLEVKTKKQNKELESGLVSLSVQPQQSCTSLQDKEVYGANKALSYKKADPDPTSVLVRTQGKESKSDRHNLDLTSVSDTVPLSLFSQLAVINKANYNKNQALRFHVGAVKADRLSDFSRSQNRIHFYDTLSQNKACQGSAPKIKSTPLQSPVSHRVWQPKRMEPSTFRVSQRSKSTHVLPKITQKDWTNILEWQLKKYFVEEDKRLLPLSLEGDKTLKIKKINIYLPWISIKKANALRCQNSVVPKLRYAKTPFLQPLCMQRPFNQNTRLASSKTGPDLLRTNEFRSNSLVSKPGSGQPSVEWPLTRLDLTKSQIKSIDLQRPSDTCFQTTNYWRLPTQQTVYTTTRTKQRSVVSKVRSNNTGKKRMHARSGVTDLSLVSTRPSVQSSSTLQTINSRGLRTTFDSKALLSKKRQGICQNVFNESILFESVTKYSWLFVYTFVFVLMFKQLFTFVYKVGLKDFFVNFLNSDFGRTITSEEFRYSIQNSPLSELYRPTKRLQDLFGLERNKVQLLEIVWFLRNNCQGRHGVRGVLLVGPPGVESVSVVQAIAGEANLPIIVQSLEKIAQDNEPQRQLEQLYTRAHKQAPCVLFLDQLDTIGARRDQLFTANTRGGIGSNSKASRVSLKEKQGGFTGEDHNMALNQSESSLYKNEDLGPHTGQGSVTPGNKLNVVLRLLTILDGITQSSGVVTVATARDLTKLDPALLRPKRFDRRIYLSLPNQQDRVYLFKVQTQSIGHVKEMPWNYLSLQTENMSAADIKSAINYSLFRAVLKNSVHTVETLEYGIDCVKTLTDKRIEKSKDHGASISGVR